MTRSGPSRKNSSICTMRMPTLSAHSFSSGEYIEPRTPIWIILAGAVPRPGPVGRAAIPRDADNGDIELCRVALDRQPHEGRDLAETRHDEAGQRLRIFFYHAAV